MDSPTSSVRSIVMSSDRNDTFKPNTGVDKRLTGVLYQDGDKRLP